MRLLSLNKGLELGVFEYHCIKLFCTHTKLVSGIAAGLEKKIWLGDPETGLFK